ncbi:MAG: DUF2238 domain-containing protein [bacterium]|nr:DUF2238 domain-containing protein [bacterium]
MEFFKTNLTAKILFLAYLALFTICAINPYARDVWWAENIPLMIIVAILVFLYFRGIRFSPLSYLMMSFLIFWHTVGGHYTFERVPFDWFNDFFGFERNMYDRIGHFSVGFYAFAIMEGILKYSLVRNRLMAFLFAIFAISFVAMGYELLEWQFAVSADSSAGSDFLGAQGDIWDAQKDMLMDTLGAILAGILFLIVRRNKIAN